MIKLKLTHTINFIILIIGLLMALGIGPTHPIMFLLYGVAIAFIFVFRSKYYYLSIIATVLTLILFVINFLFSCGVSGSFSANSIYVGFSLIISAGCVIAYFGLNSRLLLQVNKKGK